MSLYQRLQAWALSLNNPIYDASLRSTKAELLSPLRGTVVELGPGTGNNLGIFDPTVRWVGVEPNRFLHGRLRETATRLAREVEILPASAERLPFDDASVDAVVATLVLCSVCDPPVTMREVLRVLRPGGRFTFVEHVAAARKSRLRFAQRLLRPVWCALGGGCHPDRDTATTIEQTGFARVELRRFTTPAGLLAPHIAGTAWK